MESVTVELSGVGAMLTHNERLASKLDPIARQMSAISGKRTKSDEDHAEMARIEFLGGLYLTDGNRVGVPAWNVFRAVQDGAKFHKLGKQVERAVLPVGADVVEVQHSGPGTAEAMWSAGCFDQRSVKVGQSKVTRTRPRFEGWSVSVPFLIDVELLDLDDFERAATLAGQLVGIGDYRPRFGRFSVVVKAGG